MLREGLDGVEDGVSNVVFVEINLLDGATFGNVATVSSNDLLTLFGGFAPCTTTVTTPLVSATQIRFRVDFSGFDANGQCPGPDSFSPSHSGNFIFSPKPFFGSANLTVTDNSGNLVTPGGAIRIQMRTLDAFSVPTDTGGRDTTTYLTTVYGSGAVVAKTSATIDVGNPSAKRNFLVEGANTLTRNGGGGVSLSGMNC